MKAYIITGASKGLGLALLRRLLAEDTYLIGLSRTIRPDLQAEAEAAGCRLLQHSADFRRPEGLDSLMARILEPLKTEPPEAITLINNAGMLEPVMPIQEAEASLLTDHLYVNLLAPVLLTSAFLRETQAWPADKTVVNISSGAGKKPYAGWSAYCTAKAGLDMLTRCIGTEQQDQAFPARAVSIAPGVVDTGMQKLIRSTPSDRFPQVDRFVRLKEQGELFSPAEAADRIVTILQENLYQSGDVLDVRTYSSGLGS